MEKEIVELTNEELILLNLESTNKTEVIKIMANAINSQNYITDYYEFEKSLLDRENIGATSVGYYFGLPHGKSEVVKKPAIAFAILKNELDWTLDDDDDEDGKVKYIFMIAIPKSQSGDQHINILVNLSKKILDDDFREKLIKVKSRKEAVDLINS